jgi:hypothetical protein
VDNAQAERLGKDGRMAESTLSLALTDFEGEIGVFLGWGRGPTFGDPAWTTQQQNVINSCLRSGLRQFYFPSPMDGESSSYNWSFLRPTATLDLPPNASVVNLPDDFGSVDGNITVLSTASVSQPWQIVWRHEATIRQMYSVTPLLTGPTMYASIIPLKGTTGTQGQRFQLLVFPLADQDYTLQMTYYLNADCLTGAYPYAYGGAPHVETILESCLKIAEERMDDSSTVHAMKFQERLAASISMDRRLKPQSLGPNLDKSDGQPYWSREWIHYGAPAATYDGAPFG